MNSDILYMLMIYFGNNTEEIILYIRMMQLDLNFIYNWFKHSFLLMNVDETKFMIIKRGNEIISLNTTFVKNFQIVQIYLNTLD